MNMSHTERLILSNQYEILAKLNPEKADVYQRASTIIERGYCLQILELEKSFGHLDLATCQEVLDTLELHHALAISWGNLDASARADVNESRLAFNGGSPAKYIRLVSPCHPSSSGVTSMLTISPSRSTRLSDGIPWHTTWLIEMQHEWA